MRKCLKRCASLSRILFVPNITEDIVELVDKSTIFLSYKMTELEKVSAMLKPLADDRSLRLNALIGSQSEELAARLAKSGGVPDMLTRERFDDEANRIMKQLLNYVRPDPSSRRAA
jgi:hypothetical protein